MGFDFTVNGIQELFIAYNMNIACAREKITLQIYQLTNGITKVIS